MTISQRTPLGGNDNLTSPSSAWPTTVSIIARPKPDRSGGATLRPSPLLPDQLQLGGLLAELPVDLDLPAGHRQRAVFLRIGGELVQRKPKILHSLGLQHYVLAVDGNLLAEAVGMRTQLLLDQHAQRRAVPVIGDQKIVRAADGNQSRAEAIEEVLDRAGARCGLTGNGVDHRQQILASGESAP